METSIPFSVSNVFLLFSTYNFLLTFQGEGFDQMSPSGRRRLLFMIVTYALVLIS